MRGRKPKPTALKVLDGDQPCRINYDEPKFPVASSEPPAWLDRHGKEHWGELAPILLDSGVLTAADRCGLAQLCDEYSRIRKDPDDFKARDRYRRLLVEYGLTPSSRSRLKGNKAEPGDDPWIGLINTTG